MNEKITFKDRLNKGLNRAGMGAVLTAFFGAMLLILIFTLMNRNFASRNNLMQLLRSVCPYLLVGIGQGIVCLSGNIDLSIGSVAGMSAMISATLICNGMNPIPAIVLDLLACLAAGLLNGILVGKWKLSAIIATLGTMTICRGVAQLANGSYNTESVGTAPLVEKIRNLFYYGNTGFLFYIVILSALILLLFCFLLNRTATGRHIYAIGSNKEAARLSGVNLFKTVTITYMISAFCACITGLVIMSAAGMGSMQAGMNYEIYGLAAAVIGGISTLGGSGLLVGVIPGAAIWAILQNGLTMANVPVAMRNITIGIIVVVCVLMDVSGRLDKKAKLRLNAKTKSLIAVGMAVVTVLGCVLAAVLGTDSGHSSGGDTFSVKAALITMDQTDFHWTVMDEAVREKAAEYAKEGKNIELSWMAPETKDTQKQLEMINAAVANNVDYILISCTDKTSAVRSLEEAKAAGIKLIYVDSSADTDGLATFATDNYAGGVAAGESMLKLLTERGLTEGNIGIVDIDAGMETVLNRYMGFASVFEGTNFTLLERQFCSGDNAKAQEIANTFINNGVIAIYGTNENCTNGAGGAVMEARKNGNDILLVGWDKSAANFDYVEQGVIASLVIQNPRMMGEMAIDAIVKLEAGEELDPTPVDTGINLITKENLAEFR